MSRRDTYHYIVKDALIREGWTITHDPYTFDTEPQLMTDLGAERTIAAERGEEKIAIEIKSFLSVSQVVDLEKALGQYVLYKQLLRHQEPERELYLAVPTHALEGIFRQPVGRVVVEELDVKLIIFSISGTGELLWKST